ncbi:MAG TPA: Mu transposase C-terminal domain-containing protein [Phycisphaerae bacterium]|nr:Mu transposase C-terminal domain-containing protein [Phycisphaerae bacterium]
MPEAAANADAKDELRRLSEVPQGWMAVSHAAILANTARRTIYNRLAAGRLRGAMCPTPSGKLQVFIDPRSDPDLAALVAPDAEAPAAGVDAARLSQAQRNAAATRLKAVASWRAARDRLPDGADVLAAFRAWAHEHYAECGLKRPPSWSTMWRWARAVQTGRGAAAVAPQRRGPAASEPSAQGWALFQSLWLDKNKRTVRDCWRQVRAAAHKNRWEWISYPACLVKVRDEIPKATKVLYRYGEKAYDDQCCPFIERDYESIAPNDWWVADHRQLDVACLGPGGRPAFPWITRWMDVRSRKVVGRAMTFGPDTDILMASLRRAMLKHGVPRNGYFDNGRDFKAKTFTGGSRRFRYEVDEQRVRAALAHLPMEVHFARRFNAKAKPIERFYGTMSSQFDRQFLTWRGNSIPNRPEKMGQLMKAYREQNLLPTAADLEAALIEWEDEVYANTPHRGQGMNGRTPNEVYGDGTGPRTVTRVSEDELILLMMRTSDTRTVARNGVKHWGLYFNSPELMGIQGRKVYLRFDPAEIGRVYVHDLRDRLICVAQRTDLLAWGASHDDIKARMRLKAQHRKSAASFRETHEVLAGGQADALKNIARQRQAAAERGCPPPDGGGEGATVRYFRTALADTAETLKRLPRAVGMEGSDAKPRCVGSRGPLAVSQMSAREFFTGKTADDSDLDLNAAAPDADDTDDVFDNLDL